MSPDDEIETNVAEIAKTARKILRLGPICDSCLGRQFAMLSTGLTNAERGKAIKVFLSMAGSLDDSGRPHISHFNQTTTCVRYAYKSAAGWVGETIDSATPETWFIVFTAMAVDGGCNPHVAYYGEWPRYDLNHALRTDDDRYTETVVAEGTVG